MGAKEEQKVKDKKEELSLGEFLLRIRKTRGWDLDRVVRETKILKEILLALEREEFYKLPPPVYLKGILKKYARYLKVDPDKLISLYEKSNHRDLVSGKSDKLPHNRFFVPVAQLGRRIQLVFPRLLKWIVIIILLLYFFYEVSLLVLPPGISLLYPPADLTTSNPELVIRGEVWRAKDLFLNGEPITFNEKGYFEEKIILEKGLNRLEIKAVGNLGKSSRVIRNIIYSP